MDFIDFLDWVDTLPGSYIKETEQRWFQQALENVFGYHALQLDGVWLNALEHSRIAKKWLGNV